MHILARAHSESHWFDWFWQDKWKQLCLLISYTSVSVRLMLPPASFQKPSTDRCVNNRHLHS